MLAELSIRDVVLVDRLDLTFPPGLSVLTGETGAGKSILLDALGLALGARAESGLVRTGAARAVVSASFAVARGHPLLALLQEHGFETEERLALRRVLNADGRSRAFVNDQPASIGLLRRIGEGLVEVQGQFDRHGLLDPASHRPLLDAFGGLDRLVAATGDAHAVWQQARAAHAAARAALERARAEEALLRHAVEELDGLAPQPGEAATLTARRALLANAEQIRHAVQAALEAVAGEGGAELTLGRARRHLDRVAGPADSLLGEAVAAMDRAAAELGEAGAALAAAGERIEADGAGLEAADDRLHALRAVARKHGVEPDGLAGLHRDLADQLAALDRRADTLAALARAEADGGAEYRRQARALTEARQAAAARLETAVAGELAPLRLGNARFRVAVAPLAESGWSAAGAESVSFLLATIPGAAPAPLHRVASGGELARILLALRLVLTGASPIPTLVFDEVDAGIGGAVAAAVGERLSRLGRGLQVLVVTHSPQVAARGGAHWRVAKSDAGGRLATSVQPLEPEGRCEEIARMLSGRRVTEEARAAARSLLRQGGGERA